MLIRLLICLFFNLSVSWAQTKIYQVTSPDKKIKVTIINEQHLQFQVHYKNKEIITPSPIDLKIYGAGFLAENAKILNIERKTVNQEISPVVPVKNTVIGDHYNQLILNLKKKAGLEFRVYNQGFAYRWLTHIDGEVQVDSELVQINFPQNYLSYFPKEDNFFSHHERLYQRLPIKQIPAGSFASLPCLFIGPDSMKILITESDLYDYPGLFLKKSAKSELGFTGLLPHYPLEEKKKNDRDVPVVKSASYLAKTEGGRTFPWRVFIITPDDETLMESELVFKLARPLQLEDVSWIQPGKVAWDWWNALNLYGVNFRAGINTTTYKYFVDFAARYGIEYILLDEGWYKLGDLLSVVPQIDMEEIVNYAHQKGVGVILWVVWKTLDEQFEPAMQQFEKWGIDGIKVDFMQRDDQWMVRYYEKVAREAAKHHLLVDFHGSYKPAGLRRAFPNVLTREGVPGLEHNKWSSEVATPEMALTLPFIRMVAGPMDYTPGAMINATKEQHHPVWNRPMSQGTRCQQLAMYVVFESPLQMLADSPSNYLREAEAMDFLSRVPTVWDETRVLKAKIADYVVVARRKGEIWYLAAITDWTPRDLEISLDFLPSGSFWADIFEDGLNADRNAIDYRRNKMKVNHKQTIKMHLAPGGGWVARIFKDDQ